MDPAVPASVTVRETIVAGVPCVWFVPPDPVPGRMAVHAFGGGFMLGDAVSHGGLVGRLALAMRSRVLLPLYRRVPEHFSPSALEDVVAVYAEVSQTPSADGTSAYYLTGDSCGGGMAVSAAIAARDAGMRLPDGIVTLGAFTDLTASGDSYTACTDSDPIVSRDFALHCAATYLNGADPRDPRASPLFADLIGLPPLLLQASASEALRDDSVRLAEHARRAGVRAELELWPDMVHVWHHFAPVLAEAREAFERIGAFVDSLPQGCA